MTSLDVRSEEVVGARRGGEERLPESVVGSTRPQDSARLPSLDGWRAISIALVVGTHCKFTAGFPPSMDRSFNWLFDGDLGVRIFFLISGLLITWLMIVEHQRTGRVNLRHFYARRALRILPVYFAFITVLALLQWFTPFHQSARAWFGNLTFLTNFVPPENWTSGHLWSLAVEEQFYVLWPTLFVLYVAAGRGRVSGWALAVPLLAAPAARTISYLHLLSGVSGSIFAGYSFFKYFDSLALGCACAVLLARRGKALQLLLEANRRLVVGTALALVFVPYVLTRWLILGIVTVPLGPTLQGVGIALLLLQSVSEPSLWFYRVLNHAVICRIGVLSYSIYIWQQLFCTRPAVFGLAKVWWLSFPLWLVPVVGVSLISYYGLERPLLRLRARFR